MNKVRFTIERAVIGGASDTAWVDDPEREDLGAAVVAQAWDDLTVEVMLTVGGATMHAAAWADPEHWAEEWAEQLGVGYDEVPAAVEALLVGAVEADAA